MNKKRIILAITGASGSLYALQFLKIMAQSSVEVHGIISEAGEKVLAIETGCKAAQLSGVCQWYAADDFTAPMASGSSRYSAMVILPCTMGTLSAVANGQSGNLVHRAADVTLKERRPLVLAVRETPLNHIHLRNMVKAHEAGAVICPATPSFYHKPQTIDELARDFACRVASILGYEVSGMKQWKGSDV